jgi:hypothetical protein
MANTVNRDILPVDSVQDPVNVPPTAIEQLAQLKSKVAGLASKRIALGVGLQRADSV